MLRCAPATAALALASSLLTLCFPFFPVHPLLGLQNTRHNIIGGEEELAMDFNLSLNKKNTWEDNIFALFTALSDISSTREIYLLPGTSAIRLVSTIIAPSTGLEISVQYMGRHFIYLLLIN